MASRLRGWLGAGVNQTLVYKYFFQNAYCRRRMSVTMSKRMISYGSLFQLKKNWFSGQAQGISDCLVEVSRDLANQISKRRSFFQVEP